MFRGLLLAALGAVAVSLGSGREAAASCGDWLEGHEAHGQSIRGGAVSGSARHGSAAPAIAGGPGKRADQSAARPASGRAPCRGPACRKAPVKPLLPVDGGVIRIDLDRFAWLVGGDSPADSARGQTIATVDAAPFSAAGTRLERPPRVG